MIAAAGLWVASRMTWVEVRTFDGLGPPRTSEVAGADWSNALLPFAVLLLAAAVAGLAVRGWLLRGLAILVALVTLALGYLGADDLPFHARLPGGEPRRDAGYRSAWRGTGWGVGDHTGGQ